MTTQTTKENPHQAAIDVGFDIFVGLSRARQLTAARATLQVLSEDHRLDPVDVKRSDHLADAIAAPGEIPLPEQFAHDAKMLLMRACLEIRRGSPAAAALSPLAAVVSDPAQRDVLMLGLTQLQAMLTSSGRNSDAATVTEWLKRVTSGAQTSEVEA
jgi:hypothetical protein